MATTTFEGFKAGVYNGSVTSSEIMAACCISLAEKEALLSQLVGLGVGETAIPETSHVYVAGVGAVTVPAGMDEILVYNTSTKDALFTWVSTVTGGGTFIVPGRSTYSLDLAEKPNEGYFDTLTLAAGAGGTGAIAANEIVINFKN